MKKLFLLLFGIIPFLFCFGQPTNVIKVTDLPTFVGNPSGAWVPIVQNGATKKMDAKYFAFNQPDSFLLSNDTLYIKNRNTGINGYILFNRYVAAATAQSISGIKTFNPSATVTSAWTGLLVNPTVHINADNTDAFALRIDGSNMFVDNGHTGTHRWAFGVTGGNDALFTGNVAVSKAVQTGKILQAYDTSNHTGTQRIIVGDSAGRINAAFLNSPSNSHGGSYFGRNPVDHGFNVEVEHSVGLPGIANGASFNRQVVQNSANGEIGYVAAGNGTIPYFATYKTTSPNLPDLNSYEGTLIQYNGDTLVNIYMQSATRAEYSVTVALMERISYDGGKNWTTPFVINADPARAVRNPFGFKVSPGTIGYVYKKGSASYPYDSTGSTASIFTTDTMYYTYSGDLGQTWSAPTVIKPSTALSLIPSDEPKVFGDGYLYFCAWGLNNTMNVFRSNDGGATWATFSSAYNGTSFPTGSWNLSEPTTTYLGNNKVRMIVRNATGDTRPLVFMSNDNAQTWTYSGQLQIPYFSNSHYASKPIQYTDYANGKTFVLIGTRTPNLPQDSLLVFVNNISDVVSNPLAATIRWKFERPVPTTKFFKGYPAVCGTANGLHITFTESSPVKSNVSYSASVMSLYEADIYYSSAVYLLPNIAKGYPGASLMTNPLTGNVDFISGSSLMNSAKDQQVFFNGKDTGGVTWAMPGNIAQNGSTADSSKRAFQWLTSAGSPIAYYTNYRHSFFYNPHSVGNMIVTSDPTLFATASSQGGNSLSIVNNINAADVSANATLFINSFYRNSNIIYKTLSTAAAGLLWQSLDAATTYGQLSLSSSGTGHALSFALDGLTHAKMDSAQFDILATTKANKTYATYNAVRATAGGIGSGSVVGTASAFEVSSTWNFGNYSTGFKTYQNSGTNVRGFFAAGTAYNQFMGSTTVGDSTKIPGAILAVVSTTEGFLPPKMTTSQRNSIPSPPEGCTVYDTDLHKLYVYDGTSWQAAW